MQAIVKATYINLITILICKSNSLFNNIYNSKFNNMLQSRYRHLANALTIINLIN